MKLLLCFSFLSFRLFALDAELAGRAQLDLFAGRFEVAAGEYSRLLASDPRWAHGYYGLVRSELGAHRAEAAYAAAAEGEKNAPGTVEVLTAQGMALFRKGQLRDAEGCFKKAYALDKNYPGALEGLADIFSAVSKFKTAQKLRLAAFEYWPSDPVLLGAWAATQGGAEHEAALERLLTIYDAGSEEAAHVRAHLAADRAAKDRKLGRLSSPYVRQEIGLVRLQSGRNHPRGVGLRVTLNGRKTLTLMLDTGAGGISVSPKAAEQAGLELLSAVAGPALGIGDEKPSESFRYVASEVSIGGVSFADYPISVFKTAKSVDFDGLIGADVFWQFLVTLDFPQARMTLEPVAGREPGAEKGPHDANTQKAPGFYQILRFGHLLALVTGVNDDQGLFLIDSGASENVMDVHAAAEFTKVRKDGDTKLAGVQGKVANVSRADRVTLTFAGFRQENNHLIALDMGKLNEDSGFALTGILGIPVLSLMTVTIDYANGAVRFVRSGT